MPEGSDDGQADLLRELFRAAVDAADPAKIVPPNLPAPPAGRVLVTGAGKAAAAMARAVEANWPGEVSGLVVTRYGHGVPCERIEVVEAAHPVPDAAGERAARRILDLAQGLEPDDLMLCLISGGGSALLALPPDGLTMADKQAINSALLRSGAPIGKMNCVRKHLSAIKGGKLAIAASPAKVVTLIISDVPGDDPATVASGPTVGDATTSAEALAILGEYDIDLPERVVAHLQSAAADTPDPDDPRLAGHKVRIVGSAAGSLEAAAAVARKAGIMPVILGDAIEGEAREVARDHAALALDIKRGNARNGIVPPCVLLSGGETTVSVRGSGRGGRNGEYLLALAIALDGQEGTSALAADTDGIDGSEDNAGAIITPDSLTRAKKSGLDAGAYLRDNDAYSFFERLGDLVITGPTLTNVNDFRAILIR